MGTLVHLYTRGQLFFVVCTVLSMVILFPLSEFENLFEVVLNNVSAIFFGVVERLLFLAYYQ